MKLFALATLILIAPADELPELMPTTYATIQDAAVAALKLSYQYSNQYEYGGTVLRAPNGTFAISRPMTNFSGDSVYIDFGEGKGYVVAATYHTHACLPYSHFPNVFSPNDVILGDRHNTPGYMADLCSGIVRVYDPKVDLHNRCWFESIDPEVPPDCGSYGREVDTFPINRQPVLQEIPGPLTLARGINGW